MSAFRVQVDSGCNTHGPWRLTKRLVTLGLALAAAASMGCGKAREGTALDTGTPGAAGTAPSAGPASAEPASAEPAVEVVDASPSPQHAVGAGTAAPDSAPVCAPPGPGMCAAGERWARSPQTNDCCHYDKPCDPPTAWPRFESQAECETSCRCAQVTSQPGWLELGGYPETEHTTLDCFCGGGSCPATLDEEIASRCASGARVEVQRGCGKLLLSGSGGYSYQDLVFDEASRALIGIAVGQDTPREPCMTFNTLAGEPFDCPDAVTCAACGGGPDASSCPGAVADAGAGL